MSVITIGVGEHGATNTPGSSVKTYALGSCVSIVLLDPKTRTVGMAHIALPDSAVQPDRVKERPAYFADSGIPALFAAMEAQGCAKNGRGMIAKLAGGAKVMDHNSVFNIGKRNVLAIRKILWKYGLGPVAEDVGGGISRTVTVEVNSGKLIINSAGRGEWTI
ncbi:MAG: chemotaxis protein CheD [Proteobacteria bacterium]|nr:chemotaxis protein CheD [Pseudomonadota bacterium]MBU1610268.1 chemotaxis protein CheD [Pseudomonadota bacterium]